MKDLSIIIPIYNEAGNIQMLFERLSSVIREMHVDVEYVFVNDGSRDNSMELIKGLVGTNPEVRYLDFSRNFGHQIAVAAGLDYCTGNCAVIIDADLQDPPELIMELYNKWKQGFEVVYAKRRSREGESFLKKFTAKLFTEHSNELLPLKFPLIQVISGSSTEKLSMCSRKCRNNRNFFVGKFHGSVSVRLILNTIATNAIPGHPDIPIKKCCVLLWMELLLFPISLYVLQQSPDSLFPV